MSEKDFFRPMLPTYFPTLFSRELTDSIANLEQLFKQPIKNVFPYPMDILRIYDKETNKLKRLRFEIALAGLSKNDIQVQLKDKKFLTIKVQKPILKEEEKEYEEYVSKGISYRDGEITFRIIPELDEKLNPIFQNGLLIIDLFIKEPEKSDNIIIGEILEK